MYSYGLFHHGAEAVRTDRRTFDGVIVVYGGSAWLVLLLYGTLTLASVCREGRQPLTYRLSAASRFQPIAYKLTTLPSYITKAVRR